MAEPSPIPDPYDYSLKNLRYYLKEIKKREAQVNEELLKTRALLHQLETSQSELQAQIYNYEKAIPGIEALQHP